jgi:dinuclear metal center YbgI/SA1388 family protein
MVLAELLGYLREIAPEETAFDDDPVGLLIGSEAEAKTREITRVGVCLDATAGIVERAIEKGTQCLVAHHPLIYRPLKRIGDDPIARVCQTLVRADCALYAMHTNWDAASQGINDTLVDTLRLVNVRPLAARGEARIGRIGEPAGPMTRGEFLEVIEEYLDTWVGTSHLRENLDRSTKELGDVPVHHVAVCGGAGAQFIPEVIAAGADVFVTSDVRHHEFLDAAGWGLLLIDAGHFATEAPGMERLSELVKARFPDLGVDFLSPTDW